MGCWSSVSGGDVPRLAMRTQLRQCHTRGSQSRRVASAEATARDRTTLPRRPGGVRPGDEGTSAANARGCTIAIAG